MNQQLIADVVQQVMARLGQSPAPASSAPTAASAAQPAAALTGPGCHAAVDPAVEAAHTGQRQLVAKGLDVRDGICKLLKDLASQNAQEWGRFELQETRIGRLDHKVAKLELLRGVPGVEFLRTHAHSGDDGVALDEAAPFGVIGCVTPVTHSIPTLTCNAINMIAAGNALVINPHPGGARSAALAAAAYNRAIKDRFGIDPLIHVIEPPTLRTAEEIFKHPRVPLLVVTGGPAVAQAALRQPKRAIVAGPGNPPVVVDETADLDNAARSIIFGAAFDNNLLCIGEKEAFVVESVFAPMMEAMRRAGAVELAPDAIDRLTKAAFTWKDDHYVVNKDLVGRDPQVLGKAAGLNIPAGCELLFGETREDHPFVSEEQMMPFVPFVRARDFDHALELAIKHEHGFGHTACIHSNHLARITRMGRACNTTLFAVNGPSTGCLGAQGEGYPSYSIATPTGEGVTTPLTFTRFRRVSIVRALRVV